MFCIRTIWGDICENSAAKHCLEGKYKVNQKISDCRYCAKFWMNAGTEARKYVKIINFQKCGVNERMSQKCVNFMPNV